MIWTSTFKFCPTLFIGIKSLLIKNVFQHENTLGKWLHFVPSGYILFPLSLLGCELTLLRLKATNSDSNVPH